jgi:hypothetical protein
VRSKQTQSFDHLVGKLLQVQRHVEIKRFRGFEIYHQLKLGRLLDREVFRLNAAEHLDNQTRQLAIDKRKTRCDEKIDELAAARAHVTANYLLSDA